MFNLEFFINHIFHLSPLYGSALLLTIALAVGSQVLGVLIGCLISMGRLSRNGPVRAVASIYTWFFRGVPELVLLVLLFSGIAAADIYRFSDVQLLGLTITSSFQAAIVAIGLREGAYMGEIIRNGVQAVSRGQVEAARALGMSPVKVVTKIIAPQAMRVIVPPFGNNFNITLKVTSLASVIGVQELFSTTQTYAAVTFQTFELFIGLALNYLLLTTVWSIIQSAIEVRLRRHQPGASRESLRKRIQAHLIGTAEN